jgi:hypothetical protein
VNIRSARALIVRELRDFGLGPTLYDLSFRAVNHVVPFTIWNAIVVDKPHADYLKLPEGYEARLLDADAMLAFASAENNLEEEAVEQAQGNGDHCMAIFDHGKLASYGWYSRQPTYLNEDLRLRFKRYYVYMYKGFTHDKYRGQRLHAIGMTLALEEYLRKGFRGIVSVVASNNFGSLKSCYRMGYRDFGKIYVIKVLGRYLRHHSRGCWDYEFSIEPKPSGAERKRTVVKAA